MAEKQNHEPKQVIPLGEKQAQLCDALTGYISRALKAGATLGDVIAALEVMRQNATMQIIAAVQRGQQEAQKSQVKIATPRPGFRVEQGGGR